MADRGNYPDQRDVVTATISSGSARSNVVDLKGMSLVGIQMSTGWTDSSLGFEVSANSSSTGALQPVFNDTGGQVLFNTTGDIYIQLNSADVWLGPRYVQLHSQTANASSDTTQASERQIGLVVYPGR